MSQSPTLGLSHEQHELILDLSPDPFAIVRLRDGVIVRCNLAYGRAIGFAPEQIVGRSEEDLGISVDSQARDELIQLLVRDGFYSLVEWKVRIRDGGVRWFSVSGSLREISGERYIFAFGQNITERKQAQEALRDSEEKYARTFAGCPDGIALLDQPGFRILECNESFGRVTGYDPREAVGKTIEELGLWVSLTAAERGSIGKNLAETGEYADQEMRIRRRDGSERALIIKGCIVEIQGRECFLSISHDITERKRLEEERTKLTGELQATLESVETLRGIVPICAECKKIRNDRGYWEQLEVYIRDHSLAEFSHGLCPGCERRALEELD